MLLDRHLSNHGHAYGFIITKRLEGWEVCEEEDSVVVRHVHREDWHRVERDILFFEIKALALKREGWVEHQRSSASPRHLALRSCHV